MELFPLFSSASIIVYFQIIIYGLGDKGQTIPLHIDIQLSPNAVSDNYLSLTRFMFLAFLCFKLYSVILVNLL